MEDNKINGYIKSIEECLIEAKDRIGIIIQGIFAIAVLGVVAVLVPPLGGIIAILICLSLLALYMVSPLPMQLVLLVVNVFVPDPLPYVDECLMALSTISKARGVCRGISIAEWIFNHQSASCAIVLGVLALLFFLK